MCRPSPPFDTGLDLRLWAGKHEFGTIENDATSARVSIVNETRFVFLAH